MEVIEKVTVAHFVWLPYGIAHFKVFVKSYLAKPAFYPHQLIIVFNGLAVDHPNKPPEYIDYLKQQGIHDCGFIYFENGQDIETYKKVAAKVKTEFLLILNMFSELLAPGWLSNYVRNMVEDVGVISATASRQSYYSSVYQKHKWNWEWENGFLYNFRKYKLFVKAFFYWRFLFKPFPNPHLRTNAFMTRREEFVEIGFKFVDTKFKAYQFENGRKSMTNYYLKKGLKTLVMDKNGKTYEPHEWINSSTFWINDQENLLVADNQTRIYEQADMEERKSMTKLAWGK